MITEYCPKQCLCSSEANVIKMQPVLTERSIFQCLNF